MINSGQIESFRRDGYLHLRAFYDVENEILPVLRHIYELVGLIAQDSGITLQRKPFTTGSFDDGLFDLLAKDRRLVGQLYDAAKQIPGFVRLLASDKHQALFDKLRGPSLPAIAAGGQGIRIDLPAEERYRAPWHQDYPNQLRSLDGLVLWAPLRHVTPDLGPVEFCLGSHRDGPRRVVMGDPANPDKTGAYAMLLHEEEAVVSAYGKQTPLAMLGDLLVFDYLVIHRSGSNESRFARWSMQMRYFNFTDPVGRKNQWKGSFAAGVALDAVHPELVVK
jgi:hypothetical protein